MPYVRLPSGIKVVLEYEVFGKLVVNVYHVTTPDPIITLKLLDIAQVFKAWWDGSMSLAMSNSIELVKVTALNLDVPNGEKLELAVVPALPGQVLVPAVSNNVAIVVSFATAKTGRSFRGRAFQAGMPDDQVTGNDIDTATATFFVTSYSELISDLGIQSTDLVIASFFTEGAPRAEGVPTPVESVSVNTRVDTQRRRLPAV